MDEFGGVTGIIAVLGSTILVLGVAVFLLRLLSKLPIHGGGEGKGSPVRFLRSIPVGSKERVTLVAYRGEVFMLGVSPGSVSLLARLEEEAPPGDDAEAGETASPWLVERFREALSRAKPPAAPSKDEAA